MLIEKGHWGTFWGDGSVLFLGRGVGYLSVSFVKTHVILLKTWTVHQLYTMHRFKKTQAARMLTTLTYSGPVNLPRDTKFLVLHA